jgi:hypothetical protein
MQMIRKQREERRKEKLGEQEYILAWEFGKASLASVVHDSRDGLHH